MAQDKGALHKSKENPSMDIVDEETSIDEIK
jgi:hypothetical protein